MIEDIAVWSIPPDWRNGVTETLDFLTAVTASPLAVEQRLGLRITPRQSFECDFTVWGPTRTLFDLLTIRGGGSPMYFPLWHDVEKLTSTLLAGATVIPMSTPFTEFTTADFLILHRDPFTYEVAEIVSVTDTDVTIADPTAAEWPPGTRIYPLKKCKLENQPNAGRRADRAWVARARFQSLVPTLCDAAAPLGTFGDQLVLEEDPNEADTLAYVYSRKMTTLDNQTGLQNLYDVSGFVAQSFSWFGKGREGHSRLRGLFYQLDGRRVPLWLPSVFADFDLVADIDAADVTIDVKRCGFTLTGGPTPNRQYILIQFYDGTRLYRKITGSALLGDTAERLDIDMALGSDVSIDMIKRISFLVLSRLNQDSVEFVHHVDTKGVTTVNSVFYADPGIAGIEDIDKPIDPDDPPDDDDIIDPFKTPDQKLFMYAPFGSEGIPEPPEPPPTPLPHGDWDFVAWLETAPDSFVGGLTHELIEIETGNHLFTLPSTGSFSVRAKSYFGSEFGIPHDIGLRIRFINALDEECPAIEILSDSQHTISEGEPLEAFKPRTRIPSVIDDPDLPFQVEVQFIAGGWDFDESLILGMNVFAFANPTNNVGPPDDEAHEDDAFLIIEWWQ